MKTIRLLLLLLLLPALLHAQTASNQRVIDEALKPSPIEQNLRQLTDQVGGRVPGTPAMDKAVAWGVEALRAAGADAVHTEDFTMPHGWSEGETFQANWSESASTVRVIGSGWEFGARAHAIGWSPGVTARARVVDAGSGSPQDFAKAGDVSGAILLVHTELLKTLDELFAEYLNAPPVIDRAVKGRAKAILWMSSREHDLLYRHTNTMTGEIDRIPQAVVAREDAERIARLLAEGQKVEAAVNVNASSSGPIHAQNVVAELRGSALPNEVVILGAHLDSWDLGTGALDNGCNAALVIDALRALRAAGVKPRRTLRFVLFSGEEQGMLGSKAYVAQHRGEMDNVVAEIVFDEGTGATTGFSLGGRNDLKAALQPLLAPFAKWGVKTLTDDAFVGTDNLDFLLEGVPNLVANQQDANYLVNYHASSDTFDKVDFPQLKKHVAIAASMMAAIADAPGRLGARQTRAQVQETLRATHLDDQLKLFGLWPEWENGSRGRK